MATHDELRAIEEAERIIRQAAARIPLPVRQLPRQQPNTKHFE